MISSADVLADIDAQVRALEKSRLHGDARRYPRLTVASSRVDDLALRLSETLLSCGIQPSGEWGARPIAADEIAACIRAGKAVFYGYPLQVVE